MDFGHYIVRGGPYNPHQTTPTHPLVVQPIKNSLSAKLMSQGIAKKRQYLSKMRDQHLDIPTEVSQFSTFGKIQDGKKPPKAVIQANSVPVGNQVGGRKKRKTRKGK